VYFTDWTFSVERHPDLPGRNVAGNSLCPPPTSYNSMRILIMFTSETGVCLFRDESGGFGVAPNVLSATLSSRAEMSPERCCE